MNRMKIVALGPVHGYGISLRIRQISKEVLQVQQGSLYPALHRLEKRGWLDGRWVEKDGHRRRRYYRLTRAGRKVLASQLRGWREFVAGINSITEAENA